jgi:hypothetical protein
VRQKGFTSIFIVIAIFFVALVALGYSIFKKDTKSVTNQAQQVSKITGVENAEYFIDDQKLISFYYPKGASNVKAVSPSPVGGVTFQAYYGEWLSDPNSWSITIVSTPIYGDVEKTRNDLFNISNLKDSSIKKYIEIKEVILGGEKAIHQKEEFVPPSNIKIITMITETIHNKSLYSLGISVSDKNNQQAVEGATKAYNLIRNTFKFIN